MNDILYKLFSWKTILLFIFIISVFSTAPYMAPTLPQGIYLPYELWLIVLLVLYIILPENVGNYIYTLRLEGK